MATAVDPCLVLIALDMLEPLRRQPLNSPAYQEEVCVLALQLHRVELELAKEVRAEARRDPVS